MSAQQLHCLAQIAQGLAGGSSTEEALEKARLSTPSLEEITAVEALQVANEAAALEARKET